MLSSIDLSGWWDIRFGAKPASDGTDAPVRRIYVPSCWNEVFPDKRTYDDWAEYATTFFLPESLRERRLTLCFEGANNYVEAFLNGVSLGSHDGGFTFFAFDISAAAVLGGRNELKVYVNGRLDDWTLPPAGVDWFNFSGIYRPVYIAVSAPAHIADYRIRTRADGTLLIDAAAAGVDAPAILSVSILDGEGREFLSDARRVDAAGDFAWSLRVPDPVLWSPGASYLYEAVLRLSSPEGIPLDEVRKRFGIREFGIRGRKILVNGREAKLAGCSKHDEYPNAGRCATRQQLLKDYRMLQDMNANFVRLCHYPHSGLEHEVLNEMGFASISEIPLVFLHEKHMTSEEMLEKAKQVFLETFRREKNETNIMFWSLFIECDTHLEANKRFVKEMVDYVRSLDDTRFVVMASIRPLEDVAYDYFDVVGVNYWEGWYRDQSIRTGAEWFKIMASRYPDRPLLVTSHGWEGLYGLRNADTAVYWSEDLQARYLSEAADLYMDNENIVGEIIWTFSDFQVSKWQDAAFPDLFKMRYMERPGEMNNKGVVDQFRRPKASYFAMREKFLEWGDLAETPGAGTPRGVSVSISERNALRKTAFALIGVLEEAIARSGRAAVIWDRSPSTSELLPILAQSASLLDWTKVDLSFMGGAAAEAAASAEGGLRVRLAEALPGVAFAPTAPAAVDAALCALRVRGVPLPEEAAGAARILVLAAGAEYGPALSELLALDSKGAAGKALAAARGSGALRCFVDRKAAAGLQGDARWK